jgi:hypothetical protein
MIERLDTFKLNLLNFYLGLFLDLIYIILLENFYLVNYEFNC